MSGGGPGRAASPRARWARLLGLDPDARAWCYRWVAYSMLALGSLMVAANAFAAASAGSPAGLRPWAVSQAVTGFGLVLLALSDLLAGGAARPRRGAVAALRVVALACFAGVGAGWVWAAVNGSWAAASALGFGGACALLGLLIARARR